MVELIRKNSRATVLIRTEVYESIYNFILSTLEASGEITFYQLLDLALQNKSLKYEGDMYWCLLRVKHDMEARGIIKVMLGIGSRRVQKISLAKKKRRFRNTHFS